MGGKRITWGDDLGWLSWRWCWWPFSVVLWWRWLGRAVAVAGILGWRWRLLEYLVEGGSGWEERWQRLRGAVAAAERSGGSCCNSRFEGGGGLFFFCFRFDSSSVAAPVHSLPFFFFLFPPLFSPVFFLFLLPLIPFLFTLLFSQK